MFREFLLQGPRCQILWAWFGFFVFFGHHVFKAWLAWAINDWYEQFYDLLQEHVDYASGGESAEVLRELRAEVYDSLLHFGTLVAPAVFVHPLAGLCRNFWVFSWRRVLIVSYLHRWNTSMPAIEGASQRVHEDTQRFALGIQNCVSVVMQSLFTLVVFCPVLYDLDPDLMLVAVGAAVGGLSVSVVVGWPLVSLEVNNQRAEAELRKKLVLLENEPLSLHNNGIVHTPFKRVIEKLTNNYQRLYLSFAALGTWLSFYEQIAVILPYALVAPRLFAANAEDVLTLGQLVKVSNAFGRVFDSMNVVSDRWLEVNEWRSCLRRLREFERQTGSRSPATPARLVELESDAIVSSTTQSVV